MISEFHRRCGRPYAMGNSLIFVRCHNGCYELILTLKEGSQTVSEDSYEVLVTD